MSSIETILKNEVTAQISGFIDQNIKTAVSFLCASLPDKQINLQLAVEVEALEIKYTEIGWLSDAQKSLTLQMSYPVVQSFSTGSGHNNSGVEKIGSAEIEINWRNTGKLGKIDFTKKLLGKGVSIHAVEFSFTVKGKLQY